MKVKLFQFLWTRNLWENRSCGHTNSWAQSERYPTDDPVQAACPGVSSGCYPVNATCWSFGHPNNFIFHTRQALKVDSGFWLKRAHRIWSGDSNKLEDDFEMVKFETHTQVYEFVRDKLKTHTSAFAWSQKEPKQPKEPNDCGNPGGILNPGEPYSNAQGINLAKCLIKSAKSRNR